MASREHSLRPEELESHAAYLRALARGLVGEASAAEDLVQDTFVVALERPPRDVSGLRGWLATVVRHLAVNRRRGEGRRRAREERVARPEAVPGGDLAVERLELARLLAGEVAELREPYRTTVYLRFHEGLKPAAIAARQGVPVKTVHTRLHRALAELRGRLDQRGGDRRAWSAALFALAWPRGTAPTLAGSLTAALTGGIAVKKLALAAVLLVAVTLTWQVVRSGALAPLGLSRDGARPELTLPTGPVEVLPPPVQAPLASQPREALPDIVPVAADRGSLRVTLVWEADGSPAEDLCLDALCLDDPGPRRTRVHVLTDADGTALFEDLPVGRVRLFTANGGAEDAEVVAGQTGEYRFELAAGLEVLGTVVDPGGAPVAGAEIWVQSAGTPEWNHVLARSRADGRFHLRSLEGQSVLGARAAGWRPSLQFEPRELPVGPTGAREVTLELGEHGGRVAGRVLDPDGQPLAGALVLVGPTGSWGVDLSDGRRGYTPRQPLLVTDADGAFQQVGDLEAGPQEVHVCARGFGVWSGSVEVSQDARAWLEVQLARPVRITGRVVDSGGAPVGGARVIASREVGVEVFRDPFPPVKATCDARGIFVLDWVAPGLQELSARVPELDRLGTARASVECVPGDVREVELVLELGPTIRGRVVDIEGLPLAGWAVHGDASGWIEDKQSGRMTSLNLRRSDQTDTDGSFVLAGLTGLDPKSARGMNLRVQAPGVWWGPPRAELRGVPVGSADVELVVEDREVQLAGLRGRLIDAQGTVPQDVRVTVWDESASTGYFAEHDLTSGLFEWSVPVPGVYRVVVMRGGNALASQGPFELIAGETVDVGVISLGEPARVELRLVGPAAQERHPPQVRITSAFGLDESLEPEGGLYRSPPLGAGTWVLHVDHKVWYAPDREVELREGQTTRLEVEPVPGFPIDLSFDFAEPGASWATIEFEIRDEADRVVRRGGPWPAARLDAGVLALHRLSLPAGRFTAHAHTDSGLEAFGTLTIVDFPSARGPHRFSLR